jgi:hypothetical protein
LRGFTLSYENDTSVRKILTNNSNTNTNDNNTNNSNSTNNNANNNNNNNHIKNNKINSTKHKRNDDRFITNTNHNTNILRKFWLTIMDTIQDNQKVKTNYSNLEIDKAQIIFGIK